MRRGRLVRRDGASGRSTGSQGLALSRSSLMRNLKKEEMQARRGADGYGGRFTTRQADAVGEAEDVAEEET